MIIVQTFTINKYIIIIIFISKYEITSSKPKRFNKSSFIINFWAKP